jgi:hypothetical protein
MTKISPYPNAPSAAWTEVSAEEIPRDALVNLRKAGKATAEARLAAAREFQAEAEGKVVVIGRVE